MKQSFLRIYIAALLLTVCGGVVFSQEEGPAAVTVSYNSEAPPPSAGFPVPRPVVFEEFTAGWCGWCFSMGKALDRLEERYRPHELIVVAYHYNDGFQVNPFYNTRAGFYDTWIIPKGKINGLLLEQDGFIEPTKEESIVMSYNSINAKIQSEQL